MNARLTVFAILTLFLCTAFGQSSDQVAAEGIGIGMNRNEALNAAKRDAVEKGIGTILLSETEVENFMLKRDQIITKTIGNVRKYDVISEKSTPEGGLEIKIKAWLSKSSMREDLAAFQILLESMDKPKVMVIIDENNVGNHQPTNQAAETAVMKNLKDPYGFELVDPSVAANIKASKTKMALLDGNAAEAASIGSQYGAEVILTGTAISRKAQNLNINLGGMTSVQGEVTLKAVNCTNGRIIATENARSSKVHINPMTAGNQALEKASQKACGKLIDAIMKDWSNQLNNGVSLKISIRNVGTFKVKNAVVAALQTLGGVSKARERSWNGSSKLLQIDLTYKGNANGFGTRADGCKVGSSKLAVTGLSGSDVTLELQ
ncbi:MAG: hypothetical protein ACLFQB_05815 [Chitinispirillaceae bacterium]